MDNVIETSTSTESNRIESTKKIQYKIPERHKRITTHYYFSEVLKYPPRSEWYGPDGAISKTVRDLDGVLEFEQTKEVFELSCRCKECGIIYDGFTVKETMDILVERVQVLTAKLMISNGCGRRKRRARK
jgi:hypothetical protein